MNTIRIFIDTDIGSDVDDSFALSCALALPQVELCGISTVYGPVETRARIARQLVGAYGKEIPIGRGESAPLSDKPVWRTGNEEANLLAESGDSIFYDAVELMREKILEKPGETVLVSIAPMTNIAKLVSKYPGVLEKAKRLVFMGGGIFEKKETEKATDVGLLQLIEEYDIRSFDPRYATFYEHNLGADPESAMRVMQTSIPKLMVGRNITQEAIFPTQELMDKFTSCPAHDLLKHHCRVWQRYWKKDYFILHDPLTLMLAVFPEMILQMLAVDVWIDRKGYRDDWGTLLSHGFMFVSPSEYSPIEAVLKADIQEFRRKLRGMYFR